MAAQWALMSVALVVACVGAHPTPEQLGVGRDAPGERRIRYTHALNRHARAVNSGELEVAAVSPVGAVLDASMSSPVVRPASGFGADPTGRSDSSQAFQKAIAAALRYGSNHSMADKIRDVGGVVIDLEGGDFLVSQPLVIPAYYGNLRFQHGTLRASSSFDASRYLIEVGGTAAECTTQQKSCNENVGFAGMMLDCSNRCAGGILIQHTMGSTLSAMFFIGFTQYGLHVVSGHEVMLTTSWFGERYYGSDGAGFTKVATAVQLDGNDHIVDDVIVFSARVGVNSTGAANLIKGVHTWNDATQSGGLGIVVDAPQTRLENCYLDYNSLVVVDPQHVSVTDTFFLGGGNLVLKATKPNMTVHGLVVKDSIYNIGNYGKANYTVVLDEREGTFGDVTQSRIDESATDCEWGTPLLPKTTRVTASLTQANATKWTFNLTETLVFGRVRYASASLSSTGFGIVPWVVQGPLGGPVVTVETAEPVSGTMILTADESMPNALAVEGQDGHTTHAQEAERATE